jgi:hypothetical protein
MTTVMLLLLFSNCSLDIGRSRTIETPLSIERTSLRLCAGLVASLGRDDVLPLAARMLDGGPSDAHIHNLRLSVDGVRDGSPLSRVLRSLWRLCRFALDSGAAGQSVELQYVLTYRGLVIHRRTSVTDGVILSQAVWQGQAGPQGRLKTVWISIRARESPRGTTITTAATVRVNSGICSHRRTSRCEAVNRLAGRAISRELDQTLAEVETQARALARAGHAVLDQLATDTLTAVIRNVKGRQ